MQHIVKGRNVASLICNGSIALVSLICFILLNRQLDKGTFGNWVLFLTLCNFMDMVRYGLTKNATVRLLTVATLKARKGLLASAYLINLKLSLVLAFLCYILFGILSWASVEPILGVRLFLIWYPILAFLNLGWQNATALLQAQQKFETILMVKLANHGLFMVFLVANGFYFHFGLHLIIWASLLCNVIASIWCSIRYWDGLFWIAHAQPKVAQKLFDFGKFSVGTLVGSGLLKSSDIFIIGLSPVLGSIGVALYAIPLKFMAMVAIPMQSFAMTAYPKMSKMMLKGQKQGMLNIFYAYSGTVTLIMVPLAVFSFIYAEYLILALGGAQYADVLPTMVGVLQLFCIYMVLLPLEQFTGVLLDSIDKPKLNLYKVAIMLFANLSINVVAVFIYESLQVVAFGTLAFTLIGIGMGVYFLKREMSIKLYRVIPETLIHIKDLKTAVWL